MRRRTLRTDLRPDGGMDSSRCYLSRAELLLTSAAGLAGNALTGDALTSDRRGAIEAGMNRTLRSTVRDRTKLRDLTERRHRAELRDRTVLTLQRRMRRTLRTRLRAHGRCCVWRTLRTDVRADDYRAINPARRTSEECA